MAAIFPSDVSHDAELAQALEPLNPQSQDSLTTDSYGVPVSYSHHTMGPYSRGHVPASKSAYYMSDAHPFSTFQPSRQHRLTPRLGTPQLGTHQARKQPPHSMSAEYIPRIDRSYPPDITQLLHQLKAPSQRPPPSSHPPLPPQAIITPVHTHRPNYEEPGNSPPTLRPH